VSARILIRVNAGVVLAIGVALLVPLVISWLYGDGFWRNFLLPGAAMIALGGAGILVNRLP
jgi:hypothetical protein